MPIDPPEPPAAFRAPAREPSAQTLWIALSLVLLFAGLAIGAGAAALTGAFDPLAEVFDSLDERPVTATAPARLPPPPEIAPVEYLDVAPETAKEINDSVPFTKEPVPAAAPAHLVFRSTDDQQRAADCLAAAAWYEAGNDVMGQSAVVQVVLNRLRHAAFPKTVCGVVFQGAERQTGCQFTFTCDGSMLRRKPGQTAWQTAQGVALTAMRGVVFPRIGWATHYHTDWVVPNWSSSVDKVAAVDTHLFFRWRGANGKPGAFRGRYTGEEPSISAMTGLSLAHADDEGADAEDALALTQEAPLIALAPPESIDPKAANVNLRGGTLARANANDNLYVIRLDQGELSGATALVGVELCAGAQTACTVAGFVGPAGRAVTRGLGRVDFPDRRPDFYYFVDRSRGRERVLWNCRLAARPDHSQCLPDDFRAEG